LWANLRRAKVIEIMNGFFSPWIALIFIILHYLFFISFYFRHVLCIHFVQTMFFLKNIHQTNDNP